MTLMVAPTTGRITDRYCSSKIKTKLFRMLKHTGQLFLLLYIQAKKLLVTVFER